MGKFLEGQILYAENMQGIFSMGGTDLEKGYGGAAVMTPFFQASWRSLVYQFAINAPLMCPPPICNFRKNCIFSLVLANFSSQDAKFPDFLLPRPLNFQGKPTP